jgi:fructose-1,6-bisphosphatase/inositol monophosphatase family enzyme
LSRQNQAVRFVKSDASLVTETDLAISRLARERLAPYLADPRQILVDEETICAVGPPATVFRMPSYQWVLDPIDGTSSYALGRDGFGVCLALLHRRRPLLAGLSLPAKGILLLADGERAYRVRDGVRAALEPPRPPGFSAQNFLEVDGCFEIAHYLQTHGHGWITSGESSASQSQI